MRALLLAILCSCGSIETSGDPGPQPSLGFEQQCVTVEVCLGVEERIESTECSTTASAMTQTLLDDCNAMLPETCAGAWRCDATCVPTSKTCIE